MKIEINELPEIVKRCYFKWSELTGINNINCFFEDFFINTYSDNLKYIRVFKGKYETYFLEYLWGNDLCDFGLWDDAEVHGYMKDFIKQIDELYESIRN